MWDPGGQASHALAPTEDACVPFSHKVQLERPAEGENEFLRQSVHADAPDSEKLPASHGRQASDEFAPSEPE